MYRSPFATVRGVIKKVDLVLEVLDARFPQETRSVELEQRVRAGGKGLIIVLNKCDMVPRSEVENAAEGLGGVAPYLFVSATRKLGTKRLRDLIRKTAPRLPVKVGIVGYPNVGKSQLSNALKGRGSAGVAPVPGYTKGVQWLRVSKNILLYDTPGVVGRGEGEVELVLKGALEADACKDPVRCANAILERAEKELPGSVPDFYGVGPGVIDGRVYEEGESLLERIARKRGKLLKGGVPDERGAAVMVIRDWYKGRLKKRFIKCGREKESTAGEPSRKVL